MLQNFETPSSIADLLSSVAIHIGTGGQFTRFKRMYARDRIAFVYDILPTFAKTMAPYQEEILGYFDEGYSRVSVRGPHGLGKTALASILTQHSVLTAETDCKVPTTASAWRQLEKYLWPEIKKTGKFLDWLEIGREPYTRDEMLSMSIKLNGGTVEAFAVASDDHTTIEGAHATRIVYIFDESKTIPRATWDAAEGAFSTEGLQASEYERGILPVRGKETLSSLHGGVYEDQDTGYSYDEVVGEDSVTDSDKLNSSSGENDSLESDNVHAYVSEEKESIGNSIGASTISKTIQAREGINLPLLVSSKASNVSSVQYADNGLIDHRASAPIVQTVSSIYEALAFAISTPGDPSGQFYDIHTHKPGYEDWKTRHVTVDEAIRAGRISHKWVQQRKLQWGEDSSVFQNRVLGEFADSTEEGVIPLSWIRAAVQRWYAWEKTGFAHGGEGNLIETLGVDVARYGEDKTVIACRHGWGVSNLHIYSKLSTVQTAQNVRALCSGKRVHIEMDGGLGAAVYDILHKDGVKGIIPITVGAGTKFRDRSGELGFANVRAAMWWNLREMLDPMYNSVLKLPPLKELEIDLSAPRWDMRKNLIVLESKESIHARIGRSTDYGDAVCLSFWKASRGGGVVV